MTHHKPQRSMRQASLRQYMLTTPTCFLQELTAPPHEDMGPQPRQHSRCHVCMKG